MGGSKKTIGLLVLFSEDSQLICALLTICLQIRLLSIFLINLTNIEAEKGKAYNVSQDLAYNVCRSDSFKYSFFKYQIVKEWNRLSNHARDAGEISILNNKV